MWPTGISKLAHSVGALYLPLYMRFRLRLRFVLDAATAVAARRLPARFRYLATLAPVAVRRPNGCDELKSPVGHHTR
ncbi:MAG: hypothetical protein JWM85_2714 [Acidimicrobiaceae bacterium]|nr:hypothetical protein [Acidimicrobiaceae bacterium]